MQNNECEAEGKRRWYWNLNLLFQILITKHFRVLRNISSFVSSSLFIALSFFFIEKSCEVNPKYFLFLFNYDLIHSSSYKV